MIESRRRRNIRLRGIQERIEDEALMPFLQRLIASMGLKGGADPTLISNAFRIRKAVTAPTRASRDTIVITRDVAACAAILAHSRDKGKFQFKGCTVAVFSDLPFPMLEKRLLTPIAGQLREYSVRYWWGGDGSLIDPDN
ncbi:Hypothetical predicted protein [Pelobates cultripes]|uniref:Uncharacterized protein n=1 Tax=Pelobates cultripes TaxID=61616 RepID=A0AAD1RFL4_PELCU|nr:Hypothetical predicted protein [Pelobates cultripes]